MMKELIIFGYSGHARVVIDSAASMNLKVIGYFAPQETQQSTFDIAYLGDDDAFETKHFENEVHFFAAIGNNQIRRQIINRIVNRGFSPATIVHARSIVSSFAAVAEGTLIGPGAIINSGASIGKGTIINSGAIVEHDCRIGDFSHVAPGAVLAGNVHVGQNSFVGANAVIKEGVRIGDNVVIGAGTVVISNLESNQTRVGNPSRKLK